DYTSSDPFTSDDSSETSSDSSSDDLSDSLSGYSSSDHSSPALPLETSLSDDVVRGSDEPYSEPDIDLEIQEKINECIAYADDLRAEGIDARVVVKTVA
nr:hypothetical protein [Tanacetum cinerariifolium]